MELSPTHAALAPILGSSPGTRQLAEPKLGECSVVLTKALGRPVRAVLADPAEHANEPSGDRTADPSDPGAADDPAGQQAGHQSGPPVAPDVPDDHPLVEEVRRAFNAEIVDKVAKRPVADQPQADPG